MFKSFTTSQTKPTSYREEIVARKRLYRPYVTDGLKVYYDFANRASQQSGIARAFNLAGDDATAIHTNGPVYTPNGNLTYMSYDGVDDFSVFTYDNSNVVDSVTIEAVMNIYDWNQDGMFFGPNTYDVNLVNGFLGFNTAAGEVRGISTSDMTALGMTESTFDHYVAVFKNNAHESKLYINGELQSLSFLQGTNHRTPPALNDSSNNVWRMASWIFSNPAYQYYSKVNFSEFKLYDRELSAREVAYNYGVAKSRKGV